MNRTVFTFILLAFNLCVFSQSAFVSFVSDQAVEIDICCSVEGQYSNDIIDKHLKVTPSATVVYKKEIDTLEVINCKFNNGIWFDLFLIPDDSLTVSFSQGKVRFEGSRAQESSIIYRDYRWHLRPLLLLLINDSTDYKTIKPTFDQCVSQFYNHIDSLNNEKLSPFFKNLIKKDFLGTLSFLSSTYYRGLFIVDKNITYTDSMKISLNIDTLFQDVDIYNQLLYKMPSRSGRTLLSEHLCNAYAKLSSQEKESAFNQRNIDKESYGKYQYLSIAPDYLEKLELGSLLYSQYLQHKDEINKDLLYIYYKEKYPSSEYLIKIDSLKNEIAIRKSNIFLNETIHFIEEPISTWKDLSSYTPLKGKYLFVDLWATWCTPCISEFKHKDKLQEVLSGYTNVELVYISIDQDAAENNWKVKVSDYKLSGYHFRASKTFEDVIQNDVFNKQTITIPQYLLLDTEGNILGSDLHRPSEYEKIDEQLRLLIK